MLLPDDHRYDRARAAWNLAVDQRPAAIAYPADAGEAAEVVRAAAAAGLRIAPQATGHNAGPLGPLGEAVLVRTSGMIGTTVDPVARRARVRAGVRWLDVTEAAARHGLAARHGSSPTVGVLGYSLGGGLGWYARALGQQADAITAAELVTAGGELVRADAAHETGLLWALRGGGGNFGLVTALEFELFPAPEVYAGTLLWDVRHTEAVLRRWIDWAAGAPDEVTTTLRVLRLPDSLGGAWAGRSLVTVDGAVLGAAERAAKLLRPLRELAPAVDTFTAGPARTLVHRPAYPGGPVELAADSAVLGDLPPAAVDALLAVAGPGATAAVPLVELRQLGGALSRPDPARGPLSMMDGRFLLSAATILGGPPLAYERGPAACRRVVDAVAAYATGRPCLNFTTRAVDTRTAYPEGVWERLKVIRAAVDPDGLWLANHPI